MNNYKVSVISGIYFPEEKLFRRFLDSCLYQTLDSIEFILILDHPNDIISRNILNEYKDKFNENKNDFIIIENETNLGDLKFYNEGLEASHGEYVMFVDDDDFFDDELLEVMYNYIEKTNKKVVLNHGLAQYYTRDILYDLLDSQMIDTWSYLINKEVFIKTYKEVGDIEEVFMVLEDEGIRIPLSEGVFYHYMRHNKNVSILKTVEDENASLEYGYNDTSGRLKKFNIFISELTKEQLFSTLSKYTVLDKTINNTFSYDELKNM